MNEGFSERLRAYIDGELPPTERTEFEAIIDSDPKLQREVAELAQARDALLALPREAVPEGLTDSILAQTAAHRAPWTGWPLLLRAAVVAGLIGLPLAGFTAGYRVGVDRGVEQATLVPEDPSSGAGQNVYLVVFHGPDAADEELSPEQVSWNRRLYSEWQDGLTTSGNLITGGTIASEEPGRGAWPDGGADNTTPWYTGDWAMPSGAYLMRGWSEDEVMDLARRSPHIDLGGSITVRRVQAEAP